MINAPAPAAFKTILNTVASVEESETTGAFINAQIDLPTRHIPESLGHTTSYSYQIR